ncbi:alpha/beta hydrolase [Streptomyces mayteni]
MNIHSHFRSRRVVAAIASALAAGLLLASCSSRELALDLGDDGGRGAEGGGGAGTESIPAGDSYPGLSDALAQQRIQWGDCAAPTPLQGEGMGRPTQLSDGTPWQCGTLTVPVDYERPDGDTIDMALIRVVSTVAEEDRLGSLVFNFGGPGSSGVGTLPLIDEEYEELRTGGFDLVSFDPRGVGESAGVVCLSDDEIDEGDQEDTGPPRTAEDEAELVADSEEYAAACAANSGDLLPYLSTNNTARDMDLLRHALGDDRLNYFGISYGTELGAVYAHLFPENVGRAVLDAVVDPNPDPVAQSLLDAEGFQLALEHYLEDCAAGSDCPTGGDVETGVATIETLLDDLAVEPLPTADQEGRRLTSGLGMTGIAAALYSEDSWEYLTMGLDEALNAGSGDTLLLLADFYNGRDGEGRYSNLMPALNAIRCADDPSRMEVDEVVQHRDAFEAASPVFGEWMLWGVSGCLGWPFEEAAEPEEFSAPDAAAPLLLVATTGDPATPYAGAERMQEAIGGPSVAPLLTNDGEGHGAYTPDNACVADAVNGHLLRGETPGDGLRCE